MKKSKRVTDQFTKEGLPIYEEETVTEETPVLKTNVFAEEWRHVWRDFHGGEIGEDEEEQRSLIMKVKGLHCR